MRIVLGSMSIVRVVMNVLALTTVLRTMTNILASMSVARDMTNVLNMMTVVLAMIRRLHPIAAVNIRHAAAMTNMLHAIVTTPLNTETVALATMSAAMTVAMTDVVNTHLVAKKALSNLSTNADLASLMAEVQKIFSSPRRKPSTSNLTSSSQGMKFLSSSDRIQGTHRKPRAVKSASSKKKASLQPC